MADNLVRADATPRDDLEGTAFAHLDVRTLIGRARQGSQHATVGQTIYPANGGTHEHHRHPSAEEVVIVRSGRGWHRVGDHIYRIGPGDVVFVPVDTPHSAGADTAEDLVIIWALAGAPSLDEAGYVSVPPLGSSH